MADHHLEMPRPAQLLRTTGWSLTESVGLPVLALALGAWLWGRDAGLLAGVAVVWITAVIRKIHSGSVPSLVIISAILLTIQTAVAVGTGQLWIFLLHFPAGNLCLAILFARTASGPNPLIARLAAEVVALRQPSTPNPGLHRFFQRATWLWAAIFLLLALCLAVLLATQPTASFLLFSTVATVGLIAAGAGASALWLRVVLRRHGLGFRFAPA
jgi:preprotein translocase subunit SecG